MEYGYAKAVFGLLSVSPLTALQKISTAAKRYPELIVDSMDSIRDILPDADIVVFTSMDIFISNHRKIHKDMVCVICSGPLLLDSIPGLRPLDYSKNVSYAFDILKPEWVKVVRAARISTKKLKPTKLRVKKISHLTAIADSTVSGSEFILQFNSLNAVCNHKARHDLRRACSEYILGKSKFKTLEARVQKIFKKKSVYSDLISSIRKKNSKKTFEVVQFAYENTITSAAKHIKKYDLESFEVRFLLKMVTEHFPKAAKEK